MASSRPTAAHASVVFLRIPQFSQHPVTEQVRLKDRLEGVLSTALTGLGEPRRIVLEAPDGAAVVVLGDPEGALRLARRSIAGEAGRQLAVGVSHGPVRVAEGGTAPIVLGDGIAVAGTVAAFAPPGRVAATREFREALDRVSPSAARRLAPAGMQNDARDRAYEVFLDDSSHAAAQRRYRIMAVAALSMAIVGAGIAVRLARAPEPVPAPVTKGAVPSKAAPAVALPSPASPRPVAPAPAAQPALATLKLDIRPQGELLIDGVAKGKTPPLTSIQIPPGKYRIEVRRAGSSTLVLQVDAGPGEELAIKHTFAPPPAKSAWRKFFDQFK